MRKCILVVDDNPTDRLLVSTALSRISSDFEIVELTDGKELVNYFNSSKTTPDLVILDIKMQRMGGHEALEILQGHPKMEHTKIFVTSDSDDSSDVDNSWRLGAHYYAGKSLHFTTLVKTLQDAIGTL